MKCSWAEVVSPPCHVFFSLTVNFSGVIKRCTNFAAYTVVIANLYLAPSNVGCSVGIGNFDVSDISASTFDFNLHRI